MLNDSPHLPLTRSGRTIAALAALALAVAGCAGGDDETSSSTSASGPTSTVVDRPTRAAQLVEREQEQLLRRYQPVSRQINFFVSEYQLYRNELRSSTDVQRAIADYLPRLRAARTRVGAISVSGSTSVVQAEMLRSIARRIAALQALRRSLRSVAANPEQGSLQAPGSDRQAFDRAWQSSLTHARRATNAMQLQRDRVELPPAREDSIR